MKNMANRKGVKRWDILRQRLTAPIAPVHNLAEAKAVAEQYLKAKPAHLGELMILDDKTIQKPYGWIFFFNSKEYVLTGNLSGSLYGNGPLVVLSRSGRVVQLGSSFEPEKKILQFEQRLERIKRYLWMGLSP